MSIIFGHKSPSGKLPFTIPEKEADVVFDKENYPGENGVVHYSEGVNFGYRYFDNQKIKPLFEFGFGLSYTKFDYSDLRVYEKRVIFSLQNIGSRKGKEVAQVYLKQPQIEPYQGKFRAEKVLRAY